MRGCTGRKYTDDSNTEECGKVAFSDESSFTVKPTSIRCRVWRKYGTRYELCNMRPTFKSGYVTLSVWAAFSLYGRTPLVRIAGNLNQHKYRDIIEKYLLPFASTYHSGADNFIFQHDGCGPHRAISISNYLTENGIKLLEWPAQSPDLNPIENVWAILKRTLRARCKYPSNADILCNELCTIWEDLPNSYFASLIASMPRRVKYVKRSQGASTKY